MKRKLVDAKEAFSRKSQKLGKKSTEFQTAGEMDPTVSQHAGELAPSGLGNSSCGVTKFLDTGEETPENLENSSCSFTKFAGKVIGDLLFVEIFAGTARLSKMAKDAGFQALAIDKTSSRASQIFIAV